jgi:RNA polymerase sigma factor (sigma-70 family)
VSVNLKYSFAEQLREHQGIIYQVVRLYAYTAENRQDLFQEIVLQLWQAFPKFRQESRISTWIYRVALNTAISGLRKEKREVLVFMPDLGAFDRPENNEGAEQESQLRILYAAIRELNEVDKALVMLYLEDKSYEEMEDILGLSQGSLRVRVKRIKDRLRQLTKKEA